jgi:hypothetical protein
MERVGLQEAKDVCGVSGSKSWRLVADRERQTQCIGVTAGGGWIPDQQLVQYCNSSKY